MAKKLAVGIVGLVHDHIWGLLRHATQMPDVEIIGAADPNRPLLSRFQSETGIATTYTDGGALMDEHEMDAVLVFGTNLGSGELVEMAAERGLHAMVEKPMASDLYVADRMLVAARRYGVLLMVNWPIAWNPALNLAATLVGDGAIGRVWQLKWRGGHAGPREIGCSKYFCSWLYDAVENGAGALYDYLGYGASLARMFIGRPTQVTAIAGRLVKQDIAVDDNAVIALQYHDANAVLEATWTEAVSLQPPHDTVLYGTEGTMVIGDGQVKLYTPEKKDGEVTPAPSMEAPRRNAVEYFAHCIRSGGPVEGVCSPEHSRDAQEVMEAARISVMTGQHVALPLVEHLFGD